MIFFFIGVFLFSGSLTLQGSGNSTNLVYKAVSYIRVTLCSQHLKQSPKVLFDGCTHQRKLFFCSVPPAHSITELQSSEAPEARQLCAKVNVVPRLNGDNQLSLMLIISKSFHLLYQPSKNEENILDLSRTRFWQPADTKWYQQSAPAQEQLICSLLAPWIRPRSRPWSRPRAGAGSWECPSALHETDLEPGCRNAHAASPWVTLQSPELGSAEPCCSCRGSFETTVWLYVPHAAPSPVAVWLFSAVQGPSCAAVTYFHALVRESWKKRRKKLSRQNPQTPQQQRNKWLLFNLFFNILKLLQKITKTQIL